VKDLQESSVEFLNNLDALHQAKHLMRALPAEQVQALGDYCGMILANRDQRGAVLRFLLRDAMRAPALADTATLFEAALYSDDARRELRFRLRDRDDSKASPMPKPRNSDKAPALSTRRYDALAGAIKTAEFMDANMQRSAMMIGFACLVAWCPPLTILPPPPESLGDTSWPLAPNDWTPASEEDGEMISGMTFDDFRSGGVTRDNAENRTDGPPVG
jgi:hypothetical protein